MPLLQTRNWPLRFIRSSCALIIIALIGGVIAGCNKGVEAPDGFIAPSSTADCLPNITLTDANGHQVSLASLKGKPVLFDFFYTTCPGPCLMLTQRMKMIADQLGASLGTKAWLVSITVDPEHDRQQQLLDYTREQGAADVKGWYFLTGSPQQVDQVMARFKLKRQRESDGSVDHVLEFFLVGPDGHQMVQYLASDTDPTKIAGDVERAASGQQAVGSADAIPPG
jgi:protein SCO1/2